MSLHDNAARLATQSAISTPANGDRFYRERTDQHELPDIEVPERPVRELADVPVHVAWIRVMDDIGYIAKDGRYDGGSTKYNFRGVDAVLNAYGPVTRRHGVVVLPKKVEASYRDTKTAGGKPTRECTVLVTYEITGPRGDTMTGQAAGESLDSGDKGSAKAQSVALRMFLLHGGLVPTGDPDPDATNVERGDAAVRSVPDYLAEVQNPDTSRSRMVQIHNELKQHKLDKALVTNEFGKDEPIGALVIRIGQERFSPKAPAALEHAHQEDYDRNCEACKAEQAEADRLAAAQS